jgi:hypothetical protein
MGVPAVISDQAFSNRVLDRVAAGEQRRRRQERLRLVWPITAIVVIGVTWSIALFDAVIALRLLIEVIARISAVGALEQRLATALLGPFAPVPLMVSSLLFIAALGWVRYHLTDSLDLPQ